MVDNTPSYDLRCWNLWSSESQPIEKWAKSNGLHICYTFSAHLQPGNSPDAPLEAFQKICRLSHQPFSSDDFPKWIPQDASIYALQDIAHAVSFFARLRELTVDNFFAEKSVVVLVPAMVWDVFKDRALLSAIQTDRTMIKREGKDGAVYEYLLWNAASLDNPETWKNRDAGPLAWIGAGWAGHRMAGFLTGNEAGKPYPIPAGWEAQTGAALDRLKESLRQLQALRDTDNALPPSFNRRALQSYRRALCDFLPPHYHKDFKYDIPSNLYALPGGPILWKDTLLDDELDMHKRHLLLDGWLIPWPHGDELYIQPASLALLYWAACEEGLPHTESPEKFIENYRWKNNPHWFGGCWPGTPDKSGDVGGEN